MFDSRKFLLLLTSDLKEIWVFTKWQKGEREKYLIELHLLGEVVSELPPVLSIVV